MYKINFKMMAANYAETTKKCVTIKNYTMGTCMRWKLYVIYTHNLLPSNFKSLILQDFFTVKVHQYELHRGCPVLYG